MVDVEVIILYWQVCFYDWNWPEFVFVSKSVRSSTSVKFEFCSRPRPKNCTAQEVPDSIQNSMDGIQDKHHNHATVVSVRQVPGCNVLLSNCKRYGSPECQSGLF
jgi:hypothetical protein